uniref:Dimethylaniline monooxygenase [N-oxide-forming] n=1 Tax=Pelodiscus sinensis TaxID=13735 RepID=K7FK79_PELSI|nr:dimethylaniline monooxygenase [N-oxide-forming] 1 [Pelodiscus sinensis]XP_014431869.1 dimethylaniline monooxygenase [N-oxide-forming] 1 [Pelodiscus sinensis]XP_014431870.1 dimethylaniline monooxygenase [N-oxide-forming] 1 [Pelodiscus sinensis]|eukprot:XP_006128860.1 dimethylaniline monooxygenase [N-oxide-forming] 1 [Pelodiscus sinensis]
MVKTVAVIGAGVSGLASIKCCLDEGLQPTCFERSDDIGGLWRFTEHVEEGRPSLYKSVVSNTCKEMSAFTDFPYREDFPVFPSNSQVLEYLRMYANHFGLLKHIQFKTTVISVRKSPDFSATGQWTIVTESNGKQESSVFDAVMVCIGYLSDPSLPLESFPGIKVFQGEYFHSRHYKHPDVFEGKRVLVIGMGNSGVDIAVEASRVAKKVMISTGRGAWVISRVFDNGYPWDMIFLTRFMNVIRNSLPGPLTTWLVAHRTSQWFDHANYGLIPKDRVMIREPVLNDELPGCIITGKITVKPSVKEIKEKSVVFQNSPTEEPIDVIVFATGYKFSFPFLEESVLQVEKKQASLYKYIFPPQLEKPTLAVIGLIKPFGAVTPVFEIQARWVTRVFKGLSQLPPVSAMVEEINETKKNKVRWFGLSYDEVLKTDCLVYIDELASFIGSKPNVLALLFTDPVLAMKIFFGPCTAYQYRLTGPGKWDGARNAILTQWDRTIKPMKTRVVEEPPNFCLNLLKLMGLLALFAAIFLGFK